MQFITMYNVRLLATLKTKFSIEIMAKFLNIFIPIKCHSFPEDLTLIQLMAWCWSGNKPLPEPMITNNYIIH